MDLGTDINSSWNFDENGDLIIVKNIDNLNQALINRISCSLDNLDLFYDDYGCNLNQFLGWKKNERTLEFIKLTLIDCIEQEDRIKGHNISLEYNTNGINANLTLILNDEYIHEIKLQINDDGGVSIGN